MKKIIIFGIVFLLIGVINVTATYWCGDGLCEADYCPSDCIDFLSTYCEGLIEPWECDDLCGSELGWIRPYDCSDYGYTPTEDCGCSSTDCEALGYYIECDSCCLGGDCLGTCIDETSRTGSYDYCTERGFIDEDECPICDECMGITESECIATYDLYAYCDSCCPVCDTCPGYEHCDSCCPITTRECPFQWWLLVIGAIIGFIIGMNYQKNKKRKR